MRRARNERGQVTTAIALVVALLLLGLGFTYSAKLASAGDQGSGLQTAADAAALAGAQSVVVEVPGRIVSAIHTGKLLPGDLGLSGAREFAGRNDATVTSYRYLPAIDRVEVTVRSNAVLISGRREEAKAWARTGRRIGACSVPEPSASPTAKSTATAAPTTAPKPTGYTTTAVCGELSVPIYQPADEGLPVLKISAAALKDEFEPALSR